MNEWADELQKVFAGTSGLPEVWLSNPPSARDDQEFDVEESLAEFETLIEEGAWDGEFDDLLVGSLPSENVEPKNDEEDERPLESAEEVPVASRGDLDEFDPALNGVRKM